MKTKGIITVATAVAVAGGILFFVTKGSDGKTTQSSSTSMGTSTRVMKPTAADTPTLVAQTVGNEADCSTYSFKDLSEVWGVPFVDTDINKVSELSSEGGKQYSCAYNETNSGTGISVTIEYREHPSAESAKQSMNETRSTEKYGDTVYYLKEDKSGVGDEAFLWARNRPDGSKESNQQLYVRKGSVVFLLSGVNLAGVDASYKDKLVSSYKLHF